MLRLSMPGINRFLFSFPFSRFARAKMNQMNQLLQNKSIVPVKLTFLLSSAKWFFKSKIDNHKSEIQYGVLRTIVYIALQWLPQPIKTAKSNTLSFETLR